VLLLAPTALLENIPRQMALLHARLVCQVPIHQLLELRAARIALLVPSPRQMVQQRALAAQQEPLHQALDQRAARIALLEPTPLRLPRLALLVLLVRWALPTRQPFARLLPTLSAQSALLHALLDSIKAQRAHDRLTLSAKRAPSARMLKLLRLLAVKRQTRSAKPRLSWQCLQYLLPTHPLLQIQWCRSS
jgi:hypothetical protein